MNTATALTYQCPACAAGLSFSPEKGKLVCEFCKSEYTEDEVIAANERALAEAAASTAAEEAAAAADEIDDEYCAQMSEYNCSCCGAQILCNENTAATTCPYCHNPILLVGRLSGQMKPHKVIPFRLGKTDAENAFLAFAKTKWFLPRDFTSESQLKHISGVYYPFWVTDADTFADMTARAQRMRSWRVGDYRYTETSHFRLRRAGEIHFEDIVTPAMTEEDKDMLEGILPYPTDAHEDFSMPYLQGFLAQKRNVEKESVREAVRTRMMQYTQTLLRNTIHGYTSVTPNAPRLLLRQIHWSYTLMPVWVLTYLRHGKTYTFAINGYTGKLYGRFPVSIAKAALFGAALGTLCGVAMGLLKFFLF